MKKVLLRLSFSIVGWFALNFSALAAGDVSSIPSEVYYPPLDGTEEQALARMPPELQGAHGRGKPDDYLSVVLRAFRGNSQDLVRFFRWSYGSTGSAAGGELTNDVTLGLLYHWGDLRFGAALARQSLEVRRGVGKHFWLQRSGDNSAFINCFPSTARAAFLLPRP